MLPPERGGPNLGKVGMLLGAVDINVFSFSSLTLGDSGYLMAQMCWGLPVSGFFSPCLTAIAQEHTSLYPHPCTRLIHGTQAERTWGGWGATVSFAALTSIDNLHPPQLPSLGAKTLAEMGRGESAVSRSSGWGWGVAT